MTAKTQPDLCYSGDQENFFDSLDEVIDRMRDDLEEGESLIGRTYWVGESFIPAPASFFKRAADLMLEQAQDYAYEEYGECSEDFPDGLRQEAVNGLQEFIEAWAEKHIKVHFGAVRNVRSASLTQEDLT